MICVLVGATVFGAIKGVAWQIASLASIVLSYFVSLRFSDPLAESGLFGEQSPWNRYVAMLVIYLGTSLLVWLGFRVVAGAIDRVKLKEFDRQVGALFGAAKGVLFCVAITFFAVTVTPSIRDDVLSSRSGHYVAVLIDKADGVMPPGINGVIAPYLQQLGSELNGAKSPTQPAQQAQPTPIPMPLSVPNR